MEKIHVHPLSHEERDRFADQWHEVQARFVDDPAGSIERGRPARLRRDEGARLSDVGIRTPRRGSFRGPSACGPQLPRRAPDCACGTNKGQASTEDLRQGLVYYRDLFDELLDAHVAGHREQRR